MKNKLPLSNHSLLDEIKLQLSCEVLKLFKLDEIRSHSLSNIERWRSQGTFGPAYVQWLEILHDPDDRRLQEAMTGLDEMSNQLRQSSPYVGLLGQEAVRNTVMKCKEITQASCG